MCLVVGWFLVYIYLMVGCTYLYEHLKSTRFRFFMRCYAHEERNDALLNYIANGAEGGPNDDERRGGELLMDEANNRPLTTRELGELS